MSKSAAPLKIGRGQDVPKVSKELCEMILADLERAKRPVLEATKCALDNSFYNAKMTQNTVLKRKSDSSNSL